MTMPSHAARPIALAPVLAAALALAGCGGDSSTGAARAAASVEMATSPAGGTVGVALAPAPTFVVRDAAGGAIGGVPVTVRVVGGGGTISGAPARSRAGATPVGGWTLGTAAGENRLEIAVANVKPETVTVVGAAGAPAAMVVVAGDGQQAPGGRAVPTRVEFAVRDQFGNGVAGASVVMQAGGGGALGGASAGPATGTTGADGIVAAPAWILARTAVPQSLVATLATGGISATAEATVRSSFDIDVRFVGTATAAQREAFTAAAARLRAIITGDLPNVSTGGPLDVGDYCGEPSLPTINETIDDVIIYAQVKAIDGLGKVLGQAGPCAVRDAAGGRLPVIGVMAFDEADLGRMEANKTLLDVVLHEMMHVLGFSAGYFDFFGFVTGLDTDVVAFTGAGGLRGCREAGGVAACAASVPLENTGGAGTMNSHWRESTFASELMTGFISGLSRPLSGMSIGAFQDLGYEVNHDAKDAYSLATPFAASSRGDAALSVAPGAEWERVVGPRVVVSRGGVRRRLLEVP